MTDSSPLRRAKRPATILAGPYGHPFHPLLVAIPIGVWIASFIFDLASFWSVRPEDFTRGALWLVAIGLIGAVIAAGAGLLDLTRLTKGTRARRTALIHMSLNLLVVVLFFVSWLIRLSADRATTSVGGFVFSVIGLLVLTVSAYLGGVLAFHYGIRVADETTQEEGFETPAERK